MKVYAGYPFYGQNIGVLVFNSCSPRLPGDAGHAASFAYPVRYEVVDGSFIDLVEGSPEILARLQQACHNLKDQGIRGVVADCGMISLYQQELGQILPFVGSSLCQIPMVWQMIGRAGAIGILTGHSDLLKQTHLRNSGWDESIPLAIGGMQCWSHFSEIVIQGGKNLDADKMRADVVGAALQLKQEHPEIRALILECSNLATYSADVAAALSIPVFDTISAANLLQYGLNPPTYL